MSSGDRAKPPATYGERNPFDISQRSQKEVASEIAKRMAAWKQARGRSGTTTSTAPAENAPAEAAKAPGAPVLPARVPQSAERDALPDPERPVEAARAGPATRAPYFASFSLQRAMPPAPSPKQPAPGSQAGIVAGKDGDSGPGAGVPAGEAVVEQTAGPRNPADAPSPEAAELSTQRAAAATNPDIKPAPPARGADTLNARRAEARDIKARWMAARDFEQPQAAEPARDDHREASAAAPAAEQAEQHDERDIEAAPHLASAIPPIEALDEVSGRREPTLDPPSSGARGEDATGRPDAPQAADRSTASEPPEIASALPPIEALDEISGRKEPVFDQPPNAARDAPAAEPARAAVQQAAAQPRKRAAAGASGESLDSESSQRKTRLERALNLRMTEAAPRAVPAAEASGAKRIVDPPAMQTRIEARRMDPLRADPHMAAYRPVFPHIEPEAWEAMAVIDRPARRERRGTGWAIGLGAALLMIGITAPAAILRQGLDELPIDEDVAVGALPPEEAAGPPVSHDPAQSAAQATPPVTSQPYASKPAEPAAEAGPEPRVASSQAASSQADGAPTTKPGSGADSADDQTTLGAVRDGGALQEVPIAAAPPPWKSAQVPLVNLASQDQSRPSGAPYRPSAMVARPFVPDQTPKPFLPVPSSASRAGPATAGDAAPRTVGAATVELDPPAAQPQGASIGLRPNLIPQLKPKAAARASGAAAPKKIARKPKPFAPQSLEQMFQDLVDSISEGKPPNPALKPVPPSTRK